MNGLRGVCSSHFESLVWLMQRCCGNTVVKFVGETEIQIHDYNSSKFFNGRILDNYDSLYDSLYYD